MDELVDETPLIMEPYTPRSLKAIKRDEETANGLFDYSVDVTFRLQNGIKTRILWTNKIGGLYRIVRDRWTIVVILPNLRPNSLLGVSIFFSIPECLSSTEKFVHL